MAIPSQSEMNRMVLELMSDGEQRRRVEIGRLIKEECGFSEDEVAEKTSSGVPVYLSRVGWAVSWLNRADLLRRVSRGVYEITASGREELERNPDPQTFSIRVSDIIREVNPWGSSEDSKHVSSGQGAGLTVNREKLPKDSVSPLELLDSTVGDLNDALSDELLSSILQKDSAFFERLVVDLLRVMGYGEGVVTQRSKDGGIDGMTSTDPLGFNPVYTQAKRYEPGNVIGRPMMQAFAGALGSVSRGVFVTTSDFSAGARQFADSYPHANIVLINGKRLTELMIEFNLGVSIERSYEVKKIDLDYFDGDDV